MPDAMKPMLYPPKAKKFKEWKDADYEAAGKAIAAKIGYVPDWKAAKDMVATINKNSNLKSIVTDGQISVGVAGPDLVFRAEKTKILGANDVFDSPVAKGFAAQEKQKAANEKIAALAKYKDWLQKGANLDSIKASLTDKEFTDGLMAELKKEFATENLEFALEVKGSKNAAENEKIFNKWLKLQKNAAMPNLPEAPVINVKAENLAAVTKLAGEKKFGHMLFEKALDDCVKEVLGMMDRDNMNRIRPVWKKHADAFDAKAKDWAKLNA